MGCKRQCSSGGAQRRLRQEAVEAEQDKGKIDNKGSTRRDETKWHAQQEELHGMTSCTKCGRGCNAAGKTSEAIDRVGV